ncbi:MAG: hypothetical protein H7222_03685 [Methylotenera sp.]|nr:hypothetical protein [Oligoflexia bacterium]
MVKRIFRISAANVFKIISFALLLASTAALTACDETQAVRLNQGGTSAAVFGSSCQDNSSDEICIGLKYVVYQDSEGNSVTDEAAARENLEGINRVWKQCGIAFQIEKYEVVDPSHEGLSFGGMRSQSQTDRIRKQYEDDSRFLIVTTGAWHAQKNAWTTPPGDAPYGAVMEGGISSGYSEIYAHELGHYLNLDHVTQGVSSNVMSTVIGHRSTELDHSQCREARATAKLFWAHMLRG